MGNRFASLAERGREVDQAALRDWVHSLRLPVQLEVIRFIATEALRSSVTSRYEGRG